MKRNICVNTVTGTTIINYYKMIEFRWLRRHTLPDVEGKLLLDFFFNEAFFWREAAFLKDPWRLFVDAWLLRDADFSDFVQEAWLLTEMVRDELARDAIFAILDCLTEDLFFDRADWLVMDSSTDRVACLVSEGLFNTLVFFTKLACFSIALLADLFNDACFLMGAIVCICDQPFFTRQPQL